MKRSITDFEHSNNAITEFEQALVDYTGAPYAVVTDSCTHAIELGLRFKMPEMYATIPEMNSLSMVMTLKKLDIGYLLTEDAWENEYRIMGSNVWNSANYFEKDMFKPEFNKFKLMCISFDYDSPLNIGHGGAILTNDKKAYHWLNRAANGGRDLQIVPAEDQVEFQVGYHYMMQAEDCVIGLNKLVAKEFNTNVNTPVLNLNNISITE